MHSFGGKRAYFVFETLLVEGAELFGENHAVAGKTRGGVEFYVRGKTGFVELRSDCGGDYRRRITVADVVLNDENRANSALLAAYNRA